MKRIIADIDPDLHKQFKIKAVIDQKSMSQILIELIKKYIKGDKGEDK
jgi:predicted HicB family RNase H-like nuclease